MQRISELERSYASKALDGQFKSASSYKLVGRLETAFAQKMNTKYAIAFVNGTATLHIALEAAGVSFGDEVIVPPLTMSSPAIAVLHANAIPVFADVDERTFLITASEIEKQITQRTKAVIVVSLYGLMPDMDSIMALAKKHNIAVIEDDAQCFLGKYKGTLAGGIGDISSFSFQSSKHMTCGEGGMVTTNDEDLALKVRRYSGLGYGAIGLNKGRITKDDIQDPSYERHMVLGWNYRMSDVIGGVALGQLERLDELVGARKHAGALFLDALNDCDWLTPQHTPSECEHAYWAFTAKIDSAKVSWHTFRKKFAEFGGDGIYGAWQLSYLEPMFLGQNFLGREKILQMSGDYRYEQGLCPVAEQLQPNLLQFKTNYWDTDDAQSQADILKKTINWFNQ
ncbi:MAG: DegT/DnrJ/EryC1/StrS family aminotransferase [Clostridia bacterium]|jgi:perosamine synthetase|nr:DegT/DnrJ/EryC1/StrS family aminotransferase [Clostridia bacterium]MBT7121787.1 DegT/DnrJ/EryC1/StrS family aminotransferase [Clostridia bacterium]